MRPPTLFIIFLRLDFDGIEIKIVKSQYLKGALLC